MVLFHLKSLAVEIIETEVWAGRYPELLMMNGECHIIGGSQSRFHYKWNSKSKQLEKVFEFVFPTDEESDDEDPEYASIFEHGIVHIESQNKALLFGGFADEYLDDVWEYDTEKKWKKLKDIKLPAEMCDFGWILTKNEDYVIIFGGEDFDGGRVRNVIIWDINGMKFYSSKLRLPYNDQFCALSMANEYSMTLLSGFIRNTANEYDMNIPLELVQLLNRYLETETIYLYGRNKGGHFLKVELQDIFKDLTFDDSQLRIDCFTSSEEDF